MPERLTERAARHFIADSRAVTAQDNAWSGSRDDAIVGPLVAQFAHAAADLLEYLVDTEGGVDGLAEYRALLHVTEAIVPKHFVEEPCECPVHRPERPGTRSARAFDYMANAHLRRAVGVGPVPDSVPVTESIRTV